MKKMDPGLSLLFCDVKNWYLIFFPPQIMRLTATGAPRASVMSCSIKI